MARHFVSKKEQKVVRDQLLSMGIDLGDRNVELDQRKDSRCYFVGGKPYIYVSDRYIPTIFLLNDIKPKGHVVVVDDGAVSHVINGANVFCKGITQFSDNIKKGDTVFVTDLRGNFIAVGVAAVSTEDFSKSNLGEAVLTIHYPGDKIIKEFYVI